MSSLFILDADRPGRDGIETCHGWVTNQDLPRPCRCAEPSSRKGQLVGTGGIDASRRPAPSARDRIPTASSPSPALLAEMALADSRRIRGILLPGGGSAPCGR